MAYLIRGAALTNYVEVARAVGLNPYRMLEKVRLPQSCLHNPDMKISAGAVGRLLEASARAAKVDNFGLRMAESRQLSNLGAVALIVREQATLRKAVEALIRHVSIHNEAISLCLDEVDDLVIISPVLAAGRPQPSRQAVELTIGVLVRLLRVFLGESWKPQSVSFVHGPPQRRDVHLRIFGPGVTFRQDFIGIVCAKGDLEKPIAAADSAMARHIQQFVDAIAARPNTSFRDNVRELVRVMLPAGTCSADQIARHLSIDRRTLHRRLTRSDETFSALVDAVRKELMARYMEDPDRTLAVIGGMLGFSEKSAFSRWFRAHFGCSASQWRFAHFESAR